MKRILVAVDNSPRALGVIDAAVALAHEKDAKLVLFRSVGIPPDLPVEALSTTPSGLVDVLLERARDGLDKLAQSLPANVLAGVEVAVGVPWQGICRQATLDDVDLIVIGAHGYGGVDRLLGTTAAKVVNHADRTVVVVREKPKSK
jgi:nucleotide-binding universal stress UspA family protein